MPDIKNDVVKIINSIIGLDMNELNESTPLLGDGAVLDSMSLVELCVNLEDYANEHGLEFDWTSSSTMSRSRSMFRTIGTLVEEFISQNKSKL